MGRYPHTALVWSSRSHVDWGVGIPISNSHTWSLLALQRDCVSSVCALLARSRGPAAISGVCGKLPSSCCLPASSPARHLPIASSISFSGFGEQRNCNKSAPCHPALSMATLTHMSSKFTRLLEASPSQRRVLFISGLRVPLSGLSAQQQCSP